MKLKSAFAQPIRPIVYIIDDDEAVRDSLSWLLGTSAYDTRCFESGEAFLAALDLTNPVACIVTDVRMPGMSGPELQDRLIAMGCDLPIIFITGHGNVSLAVTAMKKGAVDFIEKPFSDEDLREKIDFCIQGMIARWQEARENQDLAARLDQLTGREREVLQCLLDGMTNKETAHALSISIKTVEVHRSRLMEKLQARSIAEVVQIVMACHQTEDQAGHRRMLFL